MEIKSLITVFVVAYAALASAFISSTVLLDGDSKAMAMYAAGTALLLVSLIAVVFFLKNKPSDEGVSEDDWNRRS